MHADKFIAIDWGTTNRRIYVIEDGAVVARVQDSQGVQNVPRDGFAGETAALRRTYGNVPMVLAGMIGSNIGWSNAGYVAAPATLGDLASALVTVAPDIAIVPGVSVTSDGRADVMRGEEVQLLGAVHLGLAPPDALLCQPGTHCKWARMANGSLAGFTTAMTGELFALLRQYALIGDLMGGEVDVGGDFADGVDRSEDGDLLAALFGPRPAHLLGLDRHDSVASYVSGLLIGSDARAQVKRGDHVHVLASGVFGRLYASAVERIGGTSTAIDSDAAFVAGILRIRDMAR